MEPVVPKQLNYNDVLPVAIESRSNKRTFEPTNGNVFSPDGNRIIRLNINSDNLCDFTHSYLQFTVTNKTTVTPATADAALFPASLNQTKISDSAAMHLDFGMPFIKRLQILSGGQELEDIDEYGRLYSILMSAQSNPEQENDLSLNQGLLDTDFRILSDPSDGTDPNVMKQNLIALTETQGAADTAEESVAATNTRVNALQLAIGKAQTDMVNQGNTQNKYLHNGRSGFEVSSENTFSNAADGNNLQGSSIRNESIALYSDGVTGGPDNLATDDGDAHASKSSYTYNIPIVSAILNNSKYWPLIFTNLGLDIYIHLEDAINVAAFRRHIGITTLTPAYEISNVRYHAHLVDVDRSFYDRMRMAMQASGGVLQMSGTTYKHYMDSKPEGGSTHNLQISTRLKSLNALIVRPQRQELNNKTQHFCVSVGEGCFMKDYNFRIGSIQYPQRGVQLSETNMGESYSELKKTFGVLGDYSHNNWINKTTFKRGVAGNMPGSTYTFFTACYGFEGFAKTAAESGINVSDRALPVTCEIRRQQFNDAALPDNTGELYSEINIKGDGADWNADAGTRTQVTGYKLEASTNIRYDIFAVTDMIIYITADGSVSTRI